MRRTWLLPFVLLATLPSPAAALRLEWAGGERNLQVASARRCTLMVTPAPGDPLLPARWRLYWTGTSEVTPAIQFLTQPGPGDAAIVCGTGPAENDEEVRSRTSTVEFCGPIPELPTARAAYVLLVDPSVQAKFIVVGNGSLVSGAIEASEVTINGGSDEEYPAALRFVAPLEDLDGVPRAGVVGKGLDRVRKAWLYAPGAEEPADSLEILTQTATTLTVRMPASAPSGSTMVLSNGDGEPETAASTELLGVDPEAAGAARMFAPFPREPKDFALIHWNNQFHIFYTWVDGTLPDSLQSVDFGHAVSTNLYNWTNLPPVIPTRTGKFDGGHVWAPTIVESGGSFYMYYTGVTKDSLGLEGVQRIGRASSDDLMSWTREDDPVFGCGQVPWSYCNLSAYEGRQFRDPFVMFDPLDPAKPLLYYVTRLGVAYDQQIVGIGHSTHPAAAWSNLKPMWCTDAWPNNYLGFNESPHLFSHGAYWYLMLTTNSSHPIRFKVATSPTADSAQWSGQYRLYDEVGGDGNSDFWIASEYLKVGNKEYLAVSNRAAAAPSVEIREITWGTPPHFSLNPPPVTAVADGAIPPEIDLRWMSRPGSRNGVSLAVGLPAPGLTRVEIFDVLGRSVARLNDGWLPAGSSQWTWDGRSRSGEVAGSGIYFARVRTAAASRTIRVALVR